MASYWLLILSINKLMGNIEAHIAEIHNMADINNQKKLDQQLLVGKAFDKTVSKVFEAQTACNLPTTVMWLSAKKRTFCEKSKMEAYIAFKDFVVEASKDPDMVMSQTLTATVKK